MDAIIDFFKNLKPIHYLVVLCSAISMPILQKFSPQLLAISAGFFGKVGEWLKDKVWGMIERRGGKRGKKQRLNSYQIGRRIQELIDFKKQAIPIFKEVKALRRDNQLCEIRNARCDANYRALRAEFREFKKMRA